MNIFYLDTNPHVAASYHCDKHVVKMIVETAQILCTIYHSHNVEAQYKATHRNHPSTLWAGRSSSHFKWLCTLGYALCAQYTSRYNKIHKTQEVILWCIQNIDKLTFESSSFKPPTLAMPDEYKYPDAANDCVEAMLSYREYYIKEKSSICKWAYSQKPNWFHEE